MLLHTQHTWMSVPSPDKLGGLRQEGDGECFQVEVGLQFCSEPLIVCYGYGGHF